MRSTIRRTSAARRALAVVSVLGATSLGMFSTTAAYAGEPGTTDDPRATAFSGNFAGCPAGTTPLLVTDNGKSASNSLVTATVTGSNKQFLNLTFASSLTGAGVTAYVKGGPYYNQYDIVVGTSDTNGLSAPFAKSGSLPAISHYVICQTAPPPEPFTDFNPEANVAYADNLHLSDGTPVKVVPSPWAGDDGVVFIGCTPADDPSGCSRYDGGAIGIDNPITNGPLTLTGASVVISHDNGPVSCTFEIWNDLLPQTAQPGDRFVLTQTGTLGPEMPAPCKNAIDPVWWPVTNFDTSEGPLDSRETNTYNCTVPSNAPVITLEFTNEFGSYTLTVTDTDQVLNTGGVDSHACTGLDEAAPWVPVDSSNVVRTP